ncbi:hypothetical protein JL108_08145 [Aeromicrobium sp. YIM 150415]|uniref:hypothetical protein n=1 Tax=Aeromicrobium sp. YIM 150415 TaxID=2803912 RepID=UPI00196256D5|nr:hypothetical protein [Aeromicrobium sp. YIM 150415]MBM9463418.1 hypothetical protein [Aeromicrobium sp. YIM 150415]
MLGAYLIALAVGVLVGVVLVDSPLCAALLSSASFGLSIAVFLQLLPARIAFNIDSVCEPRVRTWLAGDSYWAGLLAIALGASGLAASAEAINRAAAYVPAGVSVATGITAGIWLAAKSKPRRHRLIPSGSHCFVLRNGMRLPGIVIDASTNPSGVWKAYKVVWRENDEWNCGNLDDRAVLPCSHLQHVRALNQLIFGRRCSTH